jgi:anti-anti-sigma factor
MVRADEWDASRRLCRAPSARRPWWVGQPQQPDPPLRLEVETGGARTVLFVTGALDPSTAPALDSFLEERSLAGCTVLEVDLAGVTTMASAGLSALIAVRRECEQRGIDLWLRGVQPSVWRVFEFTGLCRLFTWGDAPAEPVSGQDLALF